MLHVIVWPALPVILLQHPSIRAVVGVLGPAEGYNQSQAEKEQLHVGATEQFCLPRLGAVTLYVHYEHSSQQISLALALYV